MRKILNGFTLAEVLITLAVIGVVSAMTLPVLIQNVNDKVYAEREGNISFKINQAMEQMRAHGLLSYNYESTEAFVDELQKYLKIAKRCSTSNIADCWPTSKVTDTNGKEYEVSKAKTGKDLQLSTETNNVGLVLADGAAILLNYDPSKKTYDVGDVVKANKDSKTGSYYTTELMSSLAYVVDVNGKSKPNSQEASKKNDIRSFNGAKFGKGCAGADIPGIGCVVNLGICYDYNGTFKIGRDTYYNRWAGAQAKCANLGMTLPDMNTLKLIAAQKANYDILPQSGIFWSSEQDRLYTAFAFQFSFWGDSETSKNMNEGAGVLCVDISSN